MKFLRFVPFLVLATLCLGAKDAPPSQQLAPLKDKLSVFESDNPDPSEIAYIGARLGSLLIAMQGYMEENPPHNPKTRLKC